MGQSRLNAEPVVQVATESLITVLTVAASLTVAPLILLVLASYPSLIGVVVPLVATVRY